MIEVHEIDVNSPLVRGMYDDTMGDIVAATSTLINAGINEGFITEERLSELEKFCDTVVSGAIGAIGEATNDGIEYSLALGQVTCHHANL